MSFEIAGRRIGSGAPLFVVAEIGLNHGGSLERALALVDAAAAGRASAIQLQTLFADELVAPGCPPPPHVDARSLADFFRRFELSAAAQRAIVDHARAQGLACIATPLSLRAVDRLERIGIDAYRIASGDLTYDSLIERCARTGKPLILSTGMATLTETAAALTRAANRGARDVALLHGVSASPVPPGSENLAAIATLREAFGRPVGLSDHAATTASVPVAVAFGASIYERHIMLDRGDGAIDAAVSSTPREFAAVVDTAAAALAAIGHGRKKCLPAEAVNLVASRRSLYAARTLPAGHLVESEDIIALRPGTGLPPQCAADLIGVRLTRTVDAGAPFLPTDAADHGRPREAA